MGKSTAGKPSNGSRPMVGGQAVLEGVMMRSPWRVAVAVRDPEGQIVTRGRPFVSLTRRNKLVGLPVVRGAVGLFEAMKLGMDALTWSAEISDPEAAKKTSALKRFLEMAFSIVLSVVLAVGLFMLVPYAAAEATPVEDNPYLFHLIAGGLRVLLLIGYMLGISLMPDIKRVFQYHGAEHKSIFAWEKALSLGTANACAQSRFHPRCGTSFLLLAAVLTMIGFSIFDAVWIATVGDFSNIFTRLLIHLPAIPVIAGLGYEVLRLVEKHADEPAWKPLVLPGFWLQKITTREPDESQVEVALASLQEALAEQEDRYEGPVRTVDVEKPSTAPEPAVV